jgi:cation transport regulator ChaC
LNRNRENQDYIFGYGSLLRDRASGQEAESPRLCHLAGFQRTWNIAMDNRRTLPGYKHYLDPRDGSRPEVFVTFVNLVPAEGHAVGGIVFPVDHLDLAALDARERNYERRDVSDCVSGGGTGRIWTYIGTGDAEDRYNEGVREGRAVVSREYLEGVRNSFRRVSEQALLDFDASTDAPECPVVDLERIDLK